MTAAIGMLRRPRSSGSSAVLIVEDEKAQCDSLAQLLKLEGFQPLTARHGAEALDVLRSAVLPDVILADLITPVMDGWTFLRTLTEDPVLASIPVIIISGYPEHVEDYPNVAAVVPKPFTIQELLAALRSIVQPASPGGSDASS